MRLISLLFLSAISFACSSGDGGEKKSASDETIAAELSEDTKRPFLPLVAHTADLKALEYWEPTDKTAIWTPKGDAKFFAGRGAVVDLEKKTLQFFTKETLDARVYGELTPLSDSAIQLFHGALQKLNRVEQAALTRLCSSSTLDEVTHLNLMFSDRTLPVVNYRYAQCQADYVDTLSMRRLEDWFFAQGAPWTP